MACNGVHRVSPVSASISSRELFQGILGCSPMRVLRNIITFYAATAAALLTECCFDCTTSGCHSSKLASLCYALLTEGHQRLSTLRYRRAHRQGKRLDFEGRWTEKSTKKETTWEELDPNAEACSLCNSPQMLPTAPKVNHSSELFQAV